MHKILILLITILLVSCKGGSTDNPTPVIEEPQEKEKIESLLNKFPVDPNFNIFKNQLEEFDGTFQATTYSSDYSDSSFALKFSLKQLSSINQITFSGGSTKRDNNDEDDIKIAYTVYEVSGSGLFRTLTEVNTGISDAEFSKTLTAAGTYNISLGTPIELDSGNYALLLKSHHTSNIKISIGFRQNQAGYRYYSYDSSFDEWRETGIAKLLIRLAGVCIETCT